MPLAPMTSLLKDARANRYAVGYFEAWNLESLLAVKDAAEAADSPVIIGFNGGFLENPERRTAEQVSHYGALGRAVAEQSNIPMALILNEALERSTLTQSLEAGFTVVMYGHLECDFDRLALLNRELVEIAHGFDAEVEAELGELPEVDTTTGKRSTGKKTDPEQAARFVKQTGIDALAVAVGNVHVLEDGESPLDLSLIETLRERVPVPLVLHGGTGISPEDLRKAISLGVSKINVGTILRRTYVNTIRSFINTHNIDQIDPGELTSTGGRMDMLAEARDAVKNEVVRLMEIFGSARKHPHGS